MRYRFYRIPYYLMKLLLMPFGLGRVAMFWEEQRALKKIRKHLSWAYVDYSDYDRPINKAGHNDIIWIYWKQGIDNAPDIVKKCVQSSLMYNKGYRHVLLDERNLHQYVSFPDFIENKHNVGRISEAHYSDMIRLQLLILYGGVWMDATCFNISDFPIAVREAPMFMFSTGNWWPYMSNASKCSNWFIKSEKGNILLKRVRNFMFEQWKRCDRPIHYYVFHFALTALTESDVECERIWNKMPFMSNLPPHLFMYSFGKEYDKSSYEYVLSQCFIHKCTYKYDKALLNCETENYLRHFLC